MSSGGMMRRFVQWIPLFRSSVRRAGRSENRRGRSDSRSLRVEPLEQRALLSVSGIGNEAFKTVGFTASGQMTSVYKSSGYNFNLKGTAVLSGGAIAYTSVGAGTISHTTVTVNSGTYNATGKSPNFSGTWKLGGYADNIVETSSGSRYGQLNGNVVVTSSSMAIPTQPTAKDLFNGTYDLTNAVFNTQDFSLNMQLTQPSGTKINYNATLTPTAKQNFDVVVTPKWNADMTAINVNVQVPGKPHKTATANSSVPVTYVQLYWANGTDFAKNKMGGALGDKLPIYWNEASGKYQVTDLPSAPAGATHLLFVTTFDGKTKVSALALPTVSVAAASVLEGNSSSPESRNVAEIPVTLSKAYSQDVTVWYTTFKGAKDTAKPGSQYVATSGSIVIHAGDTTGTIQVPILGNTTYETNKTFSVKLTKATNAGLSKTAAQAVNTIRNDDPLPQISITDVSAAEGHSGSTKFNFTVTLSNPSYQSVQVKYKTDPATATAGTDYVTKSLATLTFAPGVTTQTISVVVKGDTAVETDEAFYVNLSGAKYATILDTQGVGTILNDDLTAAQKAAATRNAAIRQLAGTADLASYFRELDHDHQDENSTDSALAPL